MPAPTNISAATAIDLGTLPASVTQTVDDAGTTYTVWYRYTAISGDVVVGLFGYGDVTYTVRTQVFNDISASFGSRIVDTGIGADANRAVQFVVSTGTTYYISFEPPAGNPSPAVLLIEAQSFAQSAAAVGMIAVPDDTPGFPLVLVSPATQSPARFITPFPAGEAGDVLNSGTVLVTDIDANGLAIYDNLFTLIATIPSVDPKTSGGAIRTCQGTQRWWVAYGVGATRFVRSVDEDGTLGSAHTLTAITDVACIAVSNDETVLYYCASSSSAIHQWDLVNDVALSDLVANTTNYQTFDLLVLSDDSIMASAIKTSATADVKAKRYDASGSLLDTYAFGSAQSFPAGTLPRLAYAINDPVSFWIWTHPDGADDGKSLFQNVTVSTGAIAASVLAREYESGVYNGTATATPDARFGNSFSCPFWIMRLSSTPAPPEAQIDPIRWLRRSPTVSSDGKRIRHTRFQVDFQPGVGLPVADGEHDRDPIVLCRTSDDGGFTWSSFREMTLGERGKYLKQMKLYQLGSAYGRVYEVSGDSPVPLCMVQAWLDISGSEH